MAKVKDSWSKPDGVPGLIGRKQVDISMLEQGSTIPHDFYEDFVAANGGYYLQRGEKRDVVLVIEGQEYQASLQSRPEGQPEQWRLLYRQSSELRSLLTERFQASAKYLQEHRTQQADGTRVFAITDDEHAEFMVFYSTDQPFRYEVEFEPIAPVRSPENVWADLCALIGEGREVKTLGTAAPNRVERQGDDQLVVRTNRGIDRLPKEWFLAGWNVLLANGYIDEAQLPGASRYRSAIVMALFALLPYVEHIAAPKIKLFLADYRYNIDDVPGLFGIDPGIPIQLTRRNANARHAVFIANGLQTGDVRTGHDLLFGVPGTVDAPLALDQVEMLREASSAACPIFGFGRTDRGYRYLGRFTLGGQEAGVVRMTRVEAGNGPTGNWIFQSNPSIYDLQGAVAQLHELTWLAKQHSARIKPGDRVFLWEAGPEAGVVAVGTVLTQPGPLPEAAAEQAFYLDKAKFGGEQTRVGLRIDQVLPRRISRRQLLEHPVLQSLTILRAPQMTNYDLTPEQAQALWALIEVPVGHRVFRLALESDELDEGQVVLPMDGSIEEVEPGDVVVATRGTHEVAAIGRMLTSGYTRRDDLPGRPHTVSVNWDLSQARRLPKVRNWSQAGLSKLSPYWKQVILDDPAPVADLAAVVAEFSAALDHSHIHFGHRHADLVRSFVTSLATKRFVILTGLSGSGKTQIALQFGRWVGQSRVIPVRPDWTGAEALFGYQDALREGAYGRPVWNVPDALAFMLDAAADPANPYVLVLDEMNLAHVERYFADFLSGVESGEPCLPNLRRQGPDWQMVTDGPERVPVPDNLFVVGTVNVDETTYMFSPKVLDRANTFEFRVDTTDLSTDAQKPVPCEPGPLTLVRGFLTVATDEQWHLRQPAANLEHFAGHLRNIHAILADAGFEFGHRVFYEAVRFIALLEQAGDSDPLHALDLQVMQKVLPRLHGTRKSLEPVLCALAQFCFDLAVPEPGRGVTSSRFNPLEPPDGTPQLPIAFGKLQRMDRSLLANQFVSFTG